MPHPANDPASYVLDNSVTERVPLQYAAGSLAASAFIAVTQILTGVTIDVPLYIALAAFAANIPFQIILFFMPNPLSIEEVQRLRVASQGLSWPQMAYYWIHKYSTLAIIFGFAATFWHFAWWLGVLFALSAWTAYRIYRYYALKDFKQHPTEYS
jgi:hypothetical protein